MAQPYYNPDSHHYNAYTHGNIHLKPMQQVQASSYSLGSTTSNNVYKSVSAYPVQDGEYNRLEAADRRLKYRIRILRLISRVIALVLSITTLAPLTMTLVKFLLTRNTFFTVNGKERTAWAHDSITWYTYMYFSVSLVSFVFNLVIVIAYWRGIKKANAVASVATCWTTTVLVGHVLIWAISAALYRYGKEPVGGKFRDLWGWTCSPAAKAIQKDITNVNFEQYCTIQSASFYSGLANTAAGILTALIFLLAALRTRSKKRVQRMNSQYQSSLEPLRF